MKKSVSFIFVFITSISCWLPACAGEYGPRDFSDVEKWTAIVTAFEPEIEAINKAFTAIPEAKIEKTVSFKGVEYQIGKYKGEPIVIFSTGVSVPNAAMTLQMALDYFPIDSVIMMGIAGAINPKFAPGDIAIPERWYFHDESVYANPANTDVNDDAGGNDETGGNGYLLPEFYEQALAAYKERAKQDPHAPNYANFGYLFPRGTSVVKEGWDSRQRMPYFTVSESLLRYAKQAIATMPDITMPSGKPIKVAVGGNGVTGSVFVDNAQYRIWLQRVFDAQVAEMESAAVGQVCFVNGVDWLVIRSVSDLAGGQKGKNQENVFEALASGTGAKLLVAILDEMSK